MLLEILKNWFRGKKPAASANKLSDERKSVRVFVSSTFNDMERERDLLVRSVFPRLRSELEKKDIALYEVDLRWGITQQEAEDGNAVRICLEEIDACQPMFLCILGERYGWKPSQDDLSNQNQEIAQFSGKSLSVTEIEIRRALRNIEQSDTAPVFLFRSTRLSNSIGHKSDDMHAMEALKASVRQMHPAAIWEYDSFEEFVTLVDQALGNEIRQWSAKQITNSHSSRQTIVHRSQPMQLLNKTASRGNVTVITGPARSGITSLVEMWLQTCKLESTCQTIHIDGRNTRRGGLAEDFRAWRNQYHDRSTNKTIGVLSLDDEIQRFLVDSQRLGFDDVIVYIDHFEEGFLTELQVDASVFPRKIPRSHRFIIATRSPKVLNAVDELGFNLIQMPELLRPAAETFITEYLAQFGKKLTTPQAERILTAKFACNIGELTLVLDELRRFGTFEEVDSRVDQLATCEDGKNLALEVLDGLKLMLSSKYAQTLDDVFIALALSLRGLEEEELCRTIAPPGENTLPPRIWSSIRIALGSSIIWRSTRIDLASGPFRQIALDIIHKQHARTNEIAHSLLNVLSTLNSARWTEEAANVIATTQGNKALAKHLGKSKNVMDLLGIGRTYALGFMEQLSISDQKHIIADWIQQVLDGSCENNTAWELGYVAVQLGQYKSASTLWQLDEKKGNQRPERRLLEGLLFKDSTQLKALQELANATPIAVSSHHDSESKYNAQLEQLWMMCVAILGSAADGTLILTKQREQVWIDTAMGCAGKLKDGNVRAQVHHLIGQLQLGRGQWRRAKKNFVTATKHARVMGNAKRLALSLERSTTVDLEQNRFSSARTSAIECISVSKLCGLIDTECLAYERLIEIERRRAEWEKAYEYAGAYLNRMHELQRDDSQALRLLQTLEP